MPHCPLSKTIYKLAPEDGVNVDGAEVEQVGAESFSHLETLDADLASELKSVGTDLYMCSIHASLVNCFGPSILDGVEVVPNLPGPCRQGQINSSRMSKF